MEGWIKIHRKLLKSHTWRNSSPEQKTVLMALLMMVNHKPGEVEIDGELIKIQPGQVLTSLNSIKENCGKGVSIQNIRTALNRFKKLKFLTQFSTNKYTVITVCKYASYQHDQQALNTEANKRLTTNKNVKEDKEVYKGNFKKPFSIIFAEIMASSSPSLFIDKESDLPRLSRIAKKIEGKIKEEKKKAGEISRHANREEVINEFKYLIKNLPQWEKENRFYPEYILNNFGSILNKISTSAGVAKNTFSIKSLKNLQK